MHINQLRYFVSVAEHRSFSKAAAAHYVSQTAVTQQVRALERRMDAQLIDRSKRPIELTAAGHVFLIEAKAILERFDRALQRTQAANTGLDGYLRIGYTKGYENSRLPELLRAFHRDFPNVTITCFRRDTDQLAQGLLSGEYDVILTWDGTGLRADERVETRLLERVPLVAALYPSHPFAHRPILRRSELKGERILFMSPSGDGHSPGDASYIQLYRHAGYQPDILLRSSDMESIILMVEAEAGISILPSYCAAPRLPGANLIFVPLEGEGEVEEIIAVWQKDAQEMALRRFLNYL